VYSAAFNRDGSRIATAAGDKTRVFGMPSPAGRSTFSADTPKMCTLPIFSADGARVVTASYDKTARIWDVRIATASGRTSLPRSVRGGCAA